MTERLRLDHVAVVLHKPRNSENIGAAARAMYNMGVDELRIVRPRNCDLSAVLKMATHAAAGVVENMQVFESLDEALAPFHFVIGTTARRGKQRQNVYSPAAAAKRLVTLSRENRIALLFGPEDRGLTNADLRRCHWLVTIPTDRFSSLNLAQAVLILCYECFRAGQAEAQPPPSRLATRHELDGMYEQVKDILVRIHYINPENPDYWMNRMRRFFTRLQLRAREVSIIRGICRQIDWYAGQRYRDGIQAGRNESCD